MGRPPLPVGTWGKIGFFKTPIGIRARVQFRDYDGTTVTVSKFGPTRAAAERALKEALRDRVTAAGKGEITSTTKFRDVAAIWLDEVRNNHGLSPGTKDQYERNLNNHVLKGLGGLLLREVRVSVVDRFIKRVAANHGPGAAKSARDITSLICGLAVRYEAMTQNPVRNIERVSSGRSQARPRALTRDEAKALVNLLRPNSELCDLAVFMLGTGMRISEALGVRRDAIDFGAGVIEVNAQAANQRGEGAVLQRRTKTDAGWRVIAVPPHIIELCRRRLDTAVPGNDLGLVFTSNRGGVRTKSNAWRRGQVDELLAGSDLDWIVPHTFRRTVATWLDEAGLSARQIADHLGHAKPSMTQDRYMGRHVACAATADALASDSYA